MISTQNELVCQSGEPVDTNFRARCPINVKALFALIATTLIHAGLLALILHGVFGVGAEPTIRSFPIIDGGMSRCQDGPSVGNDSQNQPEHAAEHRPAPAWIAFKSHTEVEDNPLWAKTDVPNEEKNSEKNAKAREIQYRGARVKRWELRFKTDGAADYVRQLSAIGAHLGIPDTEGKLMLVTKLAERPAKPAYMDVQKIDRVYWVDDNKKSAEGVGEELQLNVIPQMIVVFLPKPVEEDLFKIEMEHAKKSNITNEGDIGQTVFDVSVVKGKPVFVVISQSRK
jgi:hypothetical protein